MMPQRAKGMFFSCRLLLVSIPFLVVELLLLILVVQSAMALTIAMVYHSIICSVLLYVLYLTCKKGVGLRFALILFLSALGAGPFGIIGWILLVMLCPVISLFSTPIDQWFAELFPEKKTTEFEAIYERIDTGWDDYTLNASVSSFEDVFSFGTLTQKQAVLDAMMKDFNPIYVPLLKRALQDSSNAIRIQAATVVVQIDSTFQTTLMQLLAEKDLTTADSSIILKLGKHYDDYANLNLLSDSQQNEIQKEALFYYKEYLLSDPNNRDIWLRIARLLFHGHLFAELISWCEEYRNMFQTFPEILHSWYQEALYRTGRYQELVAISKRF